MDKRKSFTKKRKETATESESEAGAASRDTRESSVAEMEMKEPGPRSGFHGVLRYRRESEWPNTPLQTPSASDHTVLCEFCGVKAKPLLDFSKSSKPEDFCCSQYMEMFKKVEQQWRLLQEQAGESSQEHDSNVEDLRERARLQDILQQAAEKCLKKAKRQSSGNQTEIPGCKVTSSGLLTTISFRLLDYVRATEGKLLTARESDMREEMPSPSTLCTANTSFPTGFGLCHYQGHIQKFYSNGNKFLTALPDSTTRVFYPSGNLAIISFIDDTEGVCIVLDDVKSSCPIRAFFQSSGIAVCYYSNGSTRLHMDEWGGRSLNEDRSRSRKWKWTGSANIPSPFKPVHLSLNKNIGVRVQGQESVLVTFLASGQQARFSVGGCTKVSDPAPSLEKEELMLQVIQLHARLVLERLRWGIGLRSDTRRGSLRLPPVLISQGRRLLRLSSSVCMEKDRAYIQHCLRDCQ